MDAAGTAHAARIGPNAITRTAEALRAQLGPQPLAALFSAAGLGHHLEAAPTTMVPEAEVTRLHQVLRTTLGTDQARRIGRDAGLRTAAYLLQHRIPRPARWLLRRLPAPWASRLLVKAIRGHAWTFAGSAAFQVEGAHPLRLSLRGCPLCRGGSTTGPCCDFYAACFEHLFQTLVHPSARAVETECEAAGGQACRFELRW